MSLLYDVRHPIETACVSYSSRRAACRWKACRLFSRHSASTCSSSIYATININTVVLRGTLSNVSRTRVLCACAVVCISHGGTLYKETPRSTLQHNISRRRGILAPVLFCVARHSAVARCVILCKFARGENALPCIYHTPYVRGMLPPASTDVLCTVSFSTDAKTVRQC